MSNAMSSGAPSSTPRVIKKSDPTLVRIEWDDGHVTTYSTALLRRMCPCARCVDELSGLPLLDPASVPADLVQHDVKLIGNYAIAVQFSDGHATGIYPFTLLRERDPAPR